MGCAKSQPQQQQQRQRHYPFEKIVQGQCYEGTLSSPCSSTSSAMTPPHHKTSLNVNEETALTRLEIKSVQQSWSRFMDGFPQNWIDMWIDYFTAYPEAKKRYAGINDISIAELRKNPPQIFAFYMECRLQSFKKMIYNLDDPARGDKKIERGARDLFLEGVTFEGCLGFCLTLFHKVHRDYHLDAAAVKAWEKFLNKTLEIMFITYEKAAKEKAEFFASIRPKQILPAVFIQSKENAHLCTT